MFYTTFLCSKYGRRHYAKGGNKMKFISNGSCIEIVAVYSWFDVYVSNTMVLHHISKDDVDDIIKAIRLPKIN